MRRRAFCERCWTIFRLYLLGPVGVCAWCAGSRRGNLRSRLARFRPRLARSVSLDVANSSFEGQAFLGDCRFRDRRTNGAKLPHLRRACSFIERPASLASVLVETPDSLGDERIIVGHGNKLARSSCIIYCTLGETSLHQDTQPRHRRAERLRTADLVIQCLVNGRAAHREGRLGAGSSTPSIWGSRQSRKSLPSSSSGEFRPLGATAQRRKPFIGSLKHLLNFSL